MSKVSEKHEAVEKARAILEAAEQEYEAAVQDERQTKLVKDVNALHTTPESEFYGSRVVGDERSHILPFGRDYGKLSPWDTENHPFGEEWLEGVTGLIVRRTDQNRTRPTRIIYSSGLGVSERNKIGNEFLARHDQTGAKLGVYEIVGLVFYGEGGKVTLTVGDVPDTKMSLNTYK